MQAGYQPWVAKIISARDTYSSLTSFAQLPQDLPAQLRQDLNAPPGPHGRAQSSFSPSIRPVDVELHRRGLGAGVIRFM